MQRRQHVRTPSSLPALEAINASAACPLALLQASDVDPTSCLRAELVPAHTAIVVLSIATSDPLAPLLVVRLEAECPDTVDPSWLVPVVFHLQDEVEDRSASLLDGMQLR